VTLCAAFTHSIYLRWRVNFCFEFDLISVLLSVGVEGARFQILLFMGEVGGWGWGSPGFCFWLQKQLILDEDLGCNSFHN
jgi:hypothetical protein